MPSKKIETLLKIIVPENEYELCVRDISRTKVYFSCSYINCEECIMDDMHNPHKREVVRILNEPETTK